MNDDSNDLKKSITLKLQQSSKIIQHNFCPRPAFPELKITNGPQKPIYPTTKKSLVPILKSDTSKNRENKKKTITSNWEISSREPKMPNNHNLNFTNFDDDLLRIRSGNSSPKFASHHALCTNPVRNSMFQFYIPIFQ